MPSFLDICEPINDNRIAYYINTQNDVSEKLLRIEHFTPFYDFEKKIVSVVYRGKVIETFTSAMVNEKYSMHFEDFVEGFKSFVLNINP